MNQALDVKAVERHEEAEARHCGDGAAELLAEMLAHVAALQPGLDVSRGFVGTALVGAAMSAGDLPRFELAARRQHRHRRAAGLGGLGALRGLGKPHFLRRLAFALAADEIALAIEQRLDDAVHEQIGIAPDRAREVRVGLVGEAEVAAVGAGVDRLLHRAQQHRMDLRRVGPLLGGGSDRLVLGRTRIVADRQAEAERPQVVLQQRLLLRRRPFVHAIERRVLGAGDEVGRADVGGQHRLLDQPVRLVARARHDLVDVAVLVAQDLRLHGLEVDRAALDAGAQQGAVHIVEVEQMRHQRLPLARLRTPRIGEDGRDLGVGEARRRTDDGRKELVSDDLAVAVDEHVADHRQPFDIRVQRAQAIGKLLRQHRNDAARKINRGGTLVGVEVDRLAGLDVVAHVGDRDDEAPAVGDLVLADALADVSGLAVDGIVEVAGVLAVDGDERHVGEVDATFLVGGAHGVGQRRGLRQRRFGEKVRHFVLAHRDFDLHAGVVDLAEDLGDAADRLRMHRRWLGELDRHDLADLGVGDAVARHDDVLAVALVFGREQPDAALVQQAADDRRRPALEDLDDATLGPALLVVADDAGANAIAVKDRAHFLWREVEIGQLALVADDETVAIAMALDSAFDFGEQLTAFGRGWVGGCCFDGDKVRGCLRCPGGGIGRRTSFRY